ncbi:MAG: glycosyltransferase family 4 protein [Tateyamaria sp.]|uniref:glycosyltransferase family 4 protein n=1 Tax=Tateyamaria sp. TaxID=1929288 RepID=UPI00329DD441
MSGKKAPLHIAYLTGEYPAISHTFILREIAALRTRGLQISTCSIRRTGDEHSRGEAEKEAVSTTFYVLQHARNPAVLLPALALALTRPIYMWRSIRLAWTTRPAGLRAALYQLFYLVEAMVLARHLLRKDVTHLHNHFGNSSCSVAMLTSTLSGIPFSYTMHGPTIFFEPRKWRIDTKIARARFVACISHFCRSQGMIFSSPAHWHKLRIVHCAVAPEEYKPKANSAPGKRIIFVGRLAAVKGVRVLLEAFEKVHADHPSAELVLVGDGMERADIETHANALGCREKVRFTGYLSQTEVAEELARADLFALPSFAEGVPVVLMEAMASQLPVVATRIAGIPELVEDGTSGLVVPPGNVEAFAQALHRLLDDPGGRMRMGSAGRAKVETEYNLVHEAAWLEALFRDEATPDALRPTGETG